MVRKTINFIFLYLVAIGFSIESLNSVFIWYNTEMSIGTNYILILIGLISVMCFNGVVLAFIFRNKDWIKIL